MRRLVEHDLADRRSRRRTAASSATEPSTSVAPAAMFAANPVLRSSSTTTWSPRATSASTRWEPMNPAPPVTSARIVSAIGEKPIHAAASAGPPTPVLRRASAWPGASTGPARAPVRGGGSTRRAWSGRRRRWARAGRQAVVVRRVVVDPPSAPRPPRDRPRRSSSAGPRRRLEGRAELADGVDRRLDRADQPAARADRPMVRWPSSTRCTSSSSVSGNASTASKRAGGVGISSLAASSVSGARSVDGLGSGQRAAEGRATSGARPRRAPATASARPRPRAVRSAGPRCATPRREPVARALDRLGRRATARAACRRALRSRRPCTPGSLRSSSSRSSSEFIRVALSEQCGGPDGALHRSCWRCPHRLGGDALIDSPWPRRAADRRAPRAPRTRSPPSGTCATP